MTDKKRTHCFLLHDWGKWETVKMVQINEHYAGNVGLAYVQQRVCNRCNLKQMKSKTCLY